jgi:ATP:ADP antiporter, AAA family
MPRAAPYRVGAMALLLGLLIGGNNLLKILRDSVFLGHHSVSELPYLYILVAFIAGLVIATYTRYTARVSIMRLILASNATILSATVFFWIVLTYFDPGWSHYAFYIWSAMASVIAVAQAWTLTNQLFTQEEGKRFFGVIAAGGTVGGIFASFGSRWSIHLSVESNHLLWGVAAIYVAAFVLVIAVQAWLTDGTFRGDVRSMEDRHADYKVSIRELLVGSPYLKSIASVILVSVVVSTLIDFHFKTGAKQAYSSKQELAAFFSLYYGWLNVATLIVQVLFTGRVLSKLGLGTALYITPGVLLTGLLALMGWPGLLSATFTRMADAVLRNSVHRTAMEVVYMNLPGPIVKAVKTFLDVVVERLGDGTAGFLILFFSLLPVENYLNYIHLVCIGMIFIWLFLNRVLRAGADQIAVTGAADARAQRTWLERGTGE